MKGELTTTELKSIYHMSHFLLTTVCEERIGFGLGKTINKECINTSTCFLIVPIPMSLTEIYILLAAFFQSIVYSLSVLNKEVNLSSKQVWLIISEIWMTHLTLHFTVHWFGLSTFWDHMWYPIRGKTKSVNFHLASCTFGHSERVKVTWCSVCKMKGLLGIPNQTAKIHW